MAMRTNGFEIHVQSQPVAMRQYVHCNRDEYKSKQGQNINFALLAYFCQINNEANRGDTSLITSNQCAVVKQFKRGQHTFQFRRYLTHILKWSVSTTQEILINSLQPAALQLFDLGEIQQFTFNCQLDSSKLCETQIEKCKV